MNGLAQTHFHTEAKGKWEIARYSEIKMHFIMSFFFLSLAMPYQTVWPLTLTQVHGKPFASDCQVKKLH